MNDTNKLPRSIPEEQGVSSSFIQTFLEEIERQKLELHGFMFLRNGHVIAEGWWKPYEPEIPHAAYSLSKSFTSTAVGFAVHEGLISIEDPILSYFPEMITPKIQENMGELKIKHLLTMTTGHLADTARFEVTSDILNHVTDVRVGDKNRDFVRGFLELPIERTPGSYFVYNSGASHVLGAIVERIAGVHLVDYLQPRLFEPLGIENPVWQQLMDGGNTGGWGISLRTEDIASFGQFLLKKGRWKGKQILPSVWIEEATSYQVDNMTNQAQNGVTGIIDWNQGYGFQFWRCRHNAYRGDRAFGQYCIVMPDQDAVIAINGGLQDMQGVLNTVWNNLLPALQATEPVVDSFAQVQLRRKLASLELGGRNSAAKVEWSGTKSYKIEENEQGLKQISLTFTVNRCVFEWLVNDGAHNLIFGLDDWNTSNRLANKTVKVRGEWQDTEIFVIFVYQIDSPHHDRLVFRFEENKVRIQHEHLSFACLKHDFIGTAVNE